MTNINDIFLLDVKPSVKMEGIPQNLAKAVESLLLANGISKEDITYIKKNREQSLFANSINMYYEFLEKNQLYLFKEKKDIDSVLNEFSLSKICIETHVCICRYINSVSLSFLIRKKGIICILSETTNRIYDEFAALFCGYHFSEGNTCEDLDNYGYYVRGNLILFTLFGKNPTKDLLEYAKEKISLYRVDDEDFHEWLNDYKNHSNINSKLIDDIFSYSLHNDT